MKIVGVSLRITVFSVFFVVFSVGALENLSARTRGGQKNTIPPHSVDYAVDLVGYDENRWVSQIITISGAKRLAIRCKADICAKPEAVLFSQRSSPEAPPARSAVLGVGQKAVMRDVKNGATVVERSRFLTFQKFPAYTYAVRLGSRSAPNYNFGIGVYVGKTSFGLVSSAPSASAAKRNLAYFLSHVRISSSQPSQ